MSNETCWLCGKELVRYGSPDRVRLLVCPVHSTRGANPPAQETTKVERPRLAPVQEDF